MSAATLETVLSYPKLPTLPAVAVKLLELTSDPDVELSKIANLVQYDQALSAKILRTVNSSYYSLKQPCPNIKRALAYLGLNTVKSLVLGFSLVGITRKNEGFDLMDYWRRCVYSAAAARRIAMATGTCDPDEAFIAALMQDIGMLAMHAVMGDEYSQLLEETQGNHMMVPHCETETLGFNHTEVGAELAQQWNLPKQLVDPIRQHHTRSSPFGHQSALVNAVILAFRISNLVSAKESKPVLDMVSAMSQMIFHLTPEQERAILIETTQDTRELADLFELHVGDLPDVEKMFADAAGNKPASQPFPTHATPGTTTDPVTGLGNGEHFEQKLARLFEQARGSNGCIGVIMVDAGLSKALGETGGPAASDIALQAIARRLRESLGGSGIICRTGNAQFGVIVPGASRLDAARMAERARRHLERDQVDLGGTGGNVEALQMSASFGVAALEPELSTIIHEAKRLARLAEQALHAAKQAGRNCVRVYKPRVSETDAA